MRSSTGLSSRSGGSSGRDLGRGSGTCAHWHVRSTHVPCVGRKALNHWATREVQELRVVPWGRALSVITVGWKMSWWYFLLAKCLATGWILVPALTVEPLWGQWKNESSKWPLWENAVSPPLHVSSRAELCFLRLKLPEALLHLPSDWGFLKKSCSPRT